MDLCLAIIYVPYRKSAEVNAWLTKHKERIELFFLPGYSPDLNPDEWVWKNIKNDSIARIVPNHPGHLFEIAEKALRMLRHSPEKIRSFFLDPHLAYIQQVYA